MPEMGPPGEGWRSQRGRLHERGRPQADGFEGLAENRLGRSALGGWPLHFDQLRRDRRAATAARHNTPLAIAHAPGSGTGPMLILRESAVGPVPQAQVYVPGVNPREANDAPA